MCTLVWPLEAPERDNVQTDPLPALLSNLDGRTGDGVRLEATEVLNVLGYEHSVVGDGCCPHVFVRLAFECAMGRIVYGGDIVASRSKLFGDCWGVHPIEQ